MMSDDTMRRIAARIYGIEPAQIKLATLIMKRDGA